MTETQHLRRLEGGEYAFCGKTGIQVRMVEHINECTCGACKRFAQQWKRETPLPAQPFGL